MRIPGKIISSGSVLKLRRRIDSVVEPIKAQIQKKLIFFPQNGPNPFSKEYLKQYCDPADPICPFHRFVGNTKAVKRLCRAIFAAMNRYDHVANDHNFALIGPASVGKTTLAKFFAKAISLPFVNLNPNGIRNGQDIFNAIAKACEEHGVPLVANNNDYSLPPCVIFIDEVHNLKNKIQQILLTACEKKDNKLNLEDGTSVDTSNVCWIIATTDRGELFDAFDTRFNKIVLNNYSKQELSKIISLEFKYLPKDACDLVAHYNRIPREAIAFAKEMQSLKEFDEVITWEDAATQIAEDNEIDEFGLTRQRVNILKALSKQKAISRHNLSIIANCKEEELVNYILPPIMCVTDDRMPLVMTTARGFALTDEGQKELEKRGIK